MLGGDGMDSKLGYTLLDVRGFLLLRPFIPSAYDHRFTRPGAGDAYPLWGSPGMSSRGPGSLPWVIEGGGRGIQVVKSYLPALIIRWRSDGTGYSWD
jgi:hypothetical protein